MLRLNLSLNFIKKIYQYSENHFPLCGTSIGQIFARELVETYNHPIVLSSWIYCILSLFVD